MAKRTIVGITPLESNVCSGRDIQMPTLDGSVRGQERTAPSKTARAHHPVQRARRAVLREALANGRQLG